MASKDKMDIKPGDKKYDKYLKELERTESLKVYEKEYEHLGYVCGIDEVGRIKF